MSQYYLTLLNTLIVEMNTIVEIFKCGILYNVVIVCCDIVSCDVCDDIPNCLATPALTL